MVVRKASDFSQSPFHRGWGKRTTQRQSLKTPIQSRPYGLCTKNVRGGPCRAPVLFINILQQSLFVSVKSVGYRGKTRESRQHIKRISAFEIIPLFVYYMFHKFISHSSLYSAHIFCAMKGNFYLSAACVCLDLEASQEFAFVCDFVNVLRGWSKRTPADDATEEMAYNRQLSTYDLSFHVNFSRQKMWIPMSIPSSRYISI